MPVSGASQAGPASMSGTSLICGSENAALGDTLDLLAGEENVGTLGAMFLLMSKSSELSAKGQRQEVEASAKEKQEALQKMLDQLKAAEKARDKKGFWDSVGSALGKVAAVAGTVAAVAATVATCGAAAPLMVLAITGCVLSLAATAQSEFHVLDKMGMDPKTAQYVAIGCAVAGAVCSLGAGLLASGGSMANVLSNTETFSTETARWSNFVGAGASLGAGVSTATSSVIERDAKQHDINAYQQQKAMQQLQRLILQVIGDLKETVDEEEANTKRIVSAIQTQGATTLAAVGGVQV